MATLDKSARRILVVDDEPLVGESIRKVLESEHYEVVTASSAEQALEQLQNGTFDLVILDYEMPEMRGDKLAAAIRGLLPQQPVIMMTAYGEALRFAGTFPLSVDRVISKPFGTAELREVVRELCSAS